MKIYCCLPLADVLSSYYVQSCCGHCKGDNIINKTIINICFGLQITKKLQTVKNKFYK